MRYLTLWTLRFERLQCSCSVGTVLTRGAHTHSLTRSHVPAHSVHTIRIGHNNIGTPGFVKLAHLLSQDAGDSHTSHTDNRAQTAEIDAQTATDAAAIDTEANPTPTATAALAK